MMFCSPSLLLVSAVSLAAAGPHKYSKVVHIWLEKVWIPTQRWSVLVHDP